MSRFGDEGADEFRKRGETKAWIVWHRMRLGQELADQFVERRFDGALLALALQSCCFGGREFVKRARVLIGNDLTLFFRYLRGKYNFLNIRSQSDA